MVWDGMKTFIPAMLGQVGKGSLEVKLLQMCYPEPCECSLVSKENLFRVWGINGMCGIQSFIPAMLGEVGKCSLEIRRA